MTNSGKVFASPSVFKTHGMNRGFKYTVSLHMCGGIYLVLSSSTLSIMWGVGGALGGLGGPGGLVVIVSV